MTASDRDADVGLVHLDTDFLVVALSRAGRERRRLIGLAESACTIQISAVAWYEFARGPRTPEQLAVARSVLDEDGIIPLSEDLAQLAAELFRQLGSPRKRAADIAIAATAVTTGALLLTRNRRDFDDIPELRVETIDG
jgi:predicted nucleic acid-binding protein